MSPVPMASALAFTTHTMMDKADLQRFPVLRLDENIKLDLRKYASAKIRESVESTLENEILYTDLDGIIDKTAYISVIKYMPDTNERICQTTISVAYLQYLWIICDIAIRTYDRVMATTEYDKAGVDIQAMIGFNERLLEMPKKDIVFAMYCYGYMIDVDKFLNQTKALNELLKNSDFNDHIKYKWELAKSLTSEGPGPNWDGLQTLNMNSYYGTKANSAFMKGAAFVLLHEHAHYALGHMTKTNKSFVDKQEEEKEADYEALRVMLNDSPYEEKFSAATGILATAFSFLFIWPSLQNDAHDPHERDDDRIFTLLDHIRNTLAWNPKFESMTVYLFNLWARQNNIPDYPFPDWESPTALSDIQLFLATYNR